MPDAITPDGAYMVVYVANSQPEAHIVIGRLQSEGIPATMIFEPAGTAYGLTIGALSGYRVMVRQADYEQASQLLDDDLTDDGDDDQDQYDDEDDDDPYDDDDDDEDDEDDDYRDDEDNEDDDYEDDEDDDIGGLVDGLDE